FTSYTTDTGAPISDLEGESGIGSVFDISSGGGSATSVLLALSGGAAFFRVRVGSNPVDTSKGGFTSATWLVLIATEDSPGVWTTKAVTGIDGKPVGSLAAPDAVYVGNAPGTGITDIYQFNTVAPAYDPTNAVGTGARVVSAGGGQYFIDWQVPVSSLSTASGGVVTASTPVRLFFGSSAAANLATINKDYMTGGAVDFSNLGTVVLSPPTLTLTESKTLVSGLNPPSATVASVYDIPLTARNNGGSSLYTPSIVVTIPSGVSIVSETTATGSIGHVGQTVTWSPGTMAGGASAISASIRVSITPAIADVGTTMTIANAAAGTGTDGTATITGTGTAQTVGPIADAPHDTTTGVSCPAGTITYGDSISCTVTVTDTRVSGATVPTGTVAMSAVLGTSSACTLASATSSTATCSVTFSSTGAGTGSLSAAYAGNATHATSNGSSADITIARKALTVSVNASTRTYGAANPALSAGYSGFVLGDTSSALGGTLSFSTSATSASPVGTYPVSASGLTSANYSFTYTPANLSVTPAPLTVTANDASRGYGAVNPTFTAGYSGFVNGDDASDLLTPAVLATTAISSSPVGTYPIAVSGATSGNYDIAFVSGTLTIGKAVLIVTADDQARSYGASDPTFTASFSGFQNGDDAGDLGGTLTCTSTANEASNVGTYPITCSGLISGEYSFSYVAGDLSITPATISVTPDPQSRAYGVVNPTLTVSLGGFVNGDTASIISGAADCTTTATPTSPTGTYPIDCTIGTLSATNYVFDLTASGDLSVTQAALTVTTDDGSKAFGDPNPSFTATITGLQNGDTVGDLGGTLGFSTAAVPLSAPGSYAVTPSGLTSANYAITFADGTLTVTKRTVYVWPFNTSVPPGDPIPTSFASDVTGTVPGGPSPIGTGAADCSTDAVLGDPPGEYTITCTVGTLTSAYYDFVIGGTAVLTIGTPTLHVTVDDVSKAYGDPNPTFTVTYSGFVNGDDASALGGLPTFTTAATTGSPVGTYPVSVSGLASSTYVFDYAGGTLTVTQAAQTITFGALAGATYGDGPFDVSATSTSGLAVTFTASGSCTVSGVTVTITGAGTCTITAHQAGDVNVAAAADVPQSFTVAKATPVLTWATPADITYGTALSGTQLSASASVSGSYVYSPAGGAVLAAGTHTLHVTFTPADAANYLSISTTVDLNVLTAGQTIDFPPIDNVTSDQDPITLDATASSGLPITYTVSGPCTVVGNVVTITGDGTCEVTAHQAGDGNYAAAPPVTVSFTITAPLDSSITTDRNVASPGGTVVVTATGFEPGSSVEVFIQPDGDPITVTADADGNIQVTLTIPPGTDAGPLTIEAVGVDPNGAVLDLTKTITILELPSTSTIEPAAPGAPIGSIQLVVLGLLLVAVAAGVNATTAGETSPKRPRRLPHAHRMR
ncbi:MAG TPA: MBG domain-containing protein, partial [Verrucomicrobiae bacterium]|nr:MBG domain-containing protein [Verrucomicrobiae bacterium]